VSALDPYESSLQQSNAATNGGAEPDSSRTVASSGLMEGKGMLSWNLAEKREGTSLVCGRVSGAERPAKKAKSGAGDATPGADDDDSDDESTRETLEVWLQLVEVRSCLPSFLDTFADSELLLSDHRSHNTSSCHHFDLSRTHPRQMHHHTLFLLPSHLTLSRRLRAHHQQPRQRHQQRSRRATQSRRIALLLPVFHSRRVDQDDL